MTRLTKIKAYLTRPIFHFNRLQFNLVALLFISVGLIVGIYLSTTKIILPSIFAADSPWTDTDWSTGVDYTSKSNIDNDTEGEFKLAGGSDWSETYSSWIRRKEITITNSEEAVSNYQVKVEVDYDADMQLDFDDLRFSDNSGTGLNYWIKSKEDGETADVWVNIDSLSGEGDTTIFMYYGNSSVDSTSSQILGSESNPALSCNQIYRKMMSAPNGLYYLDPDEDDTDVKQVYCDMNSETDSGWSLVMNYEHYGGLNPSVAPGSDFPSMPNGFSPQRLRVMLI